MRLSLPLLALACLAPAALARTVRVHLDVSLGTLWSDGTPQVHSALVNGTSPGPALRFQLGDFILVNVTNSLEYANTTIHWHGLSMMLTPLVDGVPLVTQWPIAPNRWFEYGFKAEQVGTYWYHSHVGLQVMSAHGAFIIEDPDDPYADEYCQDVPLMVGDTFHRPQEKILAGLYGEPFQWIGTAKALTINGKMIGGVCNETEAAAQEVSCADRPADGPAEEQPHVIHLDYEQTARLRWIGAQALMYQTIGVMNHSMKLIAADGTYIKPMEISAVEIAGGQRYDTLLTGKSEDEVKTDGLSGCYFIRSESRWREPGINSWTGLLAYPSCDIAKALSSLSAATSEKILSDAVPKFGWLTAEFEPLEGAKQEDTFPSDAEVTRRVYIDAQQIPAGPSGKGSRWANNGVVYAEESNALQNATTDTPYLIQIFKGEAEAPSYSRAMDPNQGPSGYDPVSKTWVAKAGEVIDIVIINNASATGHQVEVHPWHRHGDKHWTLASGPGIFSDAALAEARASGFKKPIARDTSVIYAGPGATINPGELLPSNSSGGWLVMRTKVQSADLGAFLLHCHIAPHSAMGMSMTWAMDVDELRTSQAMKAYSDPNILYFGRNVRSPYHEDSV